MELRLPASDEADELTGLCLRSKAVHGYDAAFMAACREELTVRLDLPDRRLVVAAIDGSPAGVAEISIAGASAELEKLFVAPEQMGKGIGRMLFDWARREAASMGADRMTIDSDRREGFLRRHGGGRGRDVAFRLDRRSLAAPAAAGSFPERNAVIILAIDTIANLCAACVWDADAGRELGRSVRDPGRGHAEHLMAVIADALAAAGTDYADLGAVAVAVGPGSFTGIRVGVAAARGLALALDIPSAGVTALDALAEEARTSFPGRAVLAVIDARREEIYVAGSDAAGNGRAGPSVMRLAEAAALARRDQPVLTGSAARLVADAAGIALDIASEAATADVAVYARLSARRGFSGEKPRPLYLREADAKPQAGFVLPRKDA